MGDNDHSAPTGAIGPRTGMEIQAFNVPAAGQEAPQSGLNLNDILFILFRHKWKILLCAAIGIVAAACGYFALPQIYESQAKLLVRYVVDRSTIDGLDSTGKPLGAQSESLLNSEVEILTSLDLAQQVAEAVGPERSGKETGTGAATPQMTSAAAARAIYQGLTVSVVKGTNIISVSYRNKDPERARLVLQGLVDRYFDKHLEVHRSVGAFDFVRRETDQLKAQLNQIDEELKQLKAKAGITSLAEDTASLASELAKTQEELDTSVGALAAQKARVAEIEKLLAGEDAQQQQQSENAVRQPSSAVLGEYQALVARIAHLREMETELLAKYTAQNRIVKVKHAQIEEQEKERRNLEKKYPGLIGTASTAGTSQSSRPDIVSERARLTELEARTETLRSRFNDLQKRSALFSEVGPKIAQLERTKEVEETNYKYYGASLEKARLDETLDPSRMPNISVVQQPSAPKASRDAGKILLGLAGGGMAVGVAIALLIELVLDRTVKRSHELEKRLRIPLLLSIPYFGSNGERFRLRDVDDAAEAHDQSESSTDSTSDPGEALRPFCEAIRDRLGLYFEMNRMTHKPKLVAVTGLSKQAGASTLAAGLAATLGDAGDGRVMLFDKPVSPKRFYDMMREFKASDLDYVVFDMPSLGDTSSTLPLAGFMDKVLLVVEAEKSSSDAVKRAYSQLAARSNVSVVFNKMRSYGPKWLHGDS